MTVTVTTTVLVRWLDCEVAEIAAELLGALTSCGAANVLLASSASRPKEV
jgi:hypothetical protein